LQGSITIAVAEPLDHRTQIAREMLIGLALPLIFVIPLTLAAIIIAVRLSFAPLRRLRDALASRGPRDLSAPPQTDLPSEVAPISGAINQLLERLAAAIAAERSFAAKAAHELRTPVTATIAQAQRLQSKTKAPIATQRGTEIEGALVRLSRLSEKMMQLARAEGGRLRTGTSQDLRPILQLVAGDFLRASGAGRIALTLSPTPVLSDLDPDVFAILCRNLIENALKHGSAGKAESITLAAEGQLIVRNEGPAIPPESLRRFTSRFARGAGAGDGSGLGLTIVQTIAERAECRFALTSPIPGKPSGIEARLALNL
jgi:two-component system OmpR family sensor kinase